MEATFSLFQRERNVLLKFEGEATRSKKLRMVLSYGLQNLFKVICAFCSQYNLYKEKKLIFHITVVMYNNSYNNIKLNVKQ